MLLAALLYWYFVIHGSAPVIAGPFPDAKTCEAIRAEIRRSSLMGTYTSSCWSASK